MKPTVKKVEKIHRSTEERKDLMKRYKALRKQGKNALDAAKEVNVPYITLRSWQVKQGLKQALRVPKALALQRGAKPRKKNGSKKRRGAVQVLPKFKGRVAIIICEKLSDAVVVLKAVK
jgi:hypothetical protein